MKSRRIELCCVCLRDYIVSTYRVCSHDTIRHVIYYKYLHWVPYFEGCVVLILSQLPLICSLLQAIVWTLYPTYNL